MDATIFYAWQSDRPAKTNRYLIRDAAIAACERITCDPTNPWSVTLDSGTQGIAGMCDIPNTILEKIERCDIFLADLTFVARTEVSEGEPQQMSNANVLFELGYAAKCLGFEVLVGVMNEAFGNIEGQVFDIKRRASLAYYVAEEDNAESRKQATQRLSQQIEAVFRTTLDTVVLQRRKAPIHIAGAYSIDLHGQKCITFKVTNTGTSPFHPIGCALLTRESGLGSCSHPRSLVHCCHTKAETMGAS
jgi:hypothetical protein